MSNKWEYKKTLWISCTDGQQHRWSGPAWLIDKGATLKPQQVWRTLFWSVVVQLVCKHDTRAADQQPSVPAEAVQMLLLKLHVNGCDALPLAVVLNGDGAEIANHQLQNLVSWLDSIDGLRGDENGYLLEMYNAAGQALHSLPLNAVGHDWLRSRFPLTCIQTTDTLKMGENISHLFFVS